MPSTPNVASTKTIKKRERRELPAMYRNPRAGTWRDPATPSERSITFEAPVLLDANGRWGLHWSVGFGGGGGGPSLPRTSGKSTVRLLRQSGLKTTKTGVVVVWGRASGPSNGAGAPSPHNLSSTC